MSDLAPLKGLTALQSLDCSNTQVSDLGPLKGLTALQSLDCPVNASERSRAAERPDRPAIARLLQQVSHLGPLKGLTALQSLNCSRK